MQINFKEHQSHVNLTKQPERNFMRYCERDQMQKEKMCLNNIIATNAFVIYNIAMYHVCKYTRLYVCNKPTYKTRIHISTWANTTQCRVLKEQ